MGRSHFDLHIMVDWSAAARPRQGADSIWIALYEPASRRGVRLVNPPTRADAFALIQDELRTATGQGKRILTGFDFPFGYPAGTAQALGLAGAPWQALWSRITECITDAPDNQNNRFEVAAAFNRAISGEAFPFWGCPPRQARPTLGPRRLRPHGAGDLAERRVADARVKGAQPVWKLYTTGSVGSQALMGIPVVHELRWDAGLTDIARIWPFETDLAPPPAQARVVFAEIYPSLWLRKAPDGVVKDAAQVEAVVRQLSALDRDGKLDRLWAGPEDLTSQEREAITREEAWILGAV